MLYTEADRLRGCGGRGGLACNGRSRQEQNEGTEKASDGRSAPIWINPDPARPDWETGKAHTTMRDQKDPESGRPKRV